MLMQPIDMHRHLGGSIPISTLCRLTKLSETEVYRQHTITRPISYRRFFERFSILEGIKWTGDILYNVILDISAEIKADKSRSALLSVSLDKYLKHNMSLDEILSVLKSSRTDAYSKIDYLLAVKYDDGDAIDKLNYNNYMTSFLEVFRGIDLVGDEHFLDTCNKEDLIKPWHDNDKIVRAHVGEYGDEENVRYVIEKLNVNRIAHGICINSPDLISKAKDKNLPFDICISSNYLTSNVKRLSDHPIKNMFDAGLRIAIGTDDPTVFNTNMLTELRYCKMILGEDYDRFFGKVVNENY